MNIQLTISTNEYVIKRQSEYLLNNFSTFILVLQFVAPFSSSQSRLFEGYICTFTLQVWKKKGGSDQFHFCY